MSGKVTYMEQATRHKAGSTKVPDTVGGRIALARQNYKINGKSMSKRELGRRLGVSHVAISLWESGDTHSLKTENLLKLCRHLHVTQEWVLHGKEVSKVQLSDEAMELAHAYDKMPDGEMKERAYYFITTYLVFNKASQGEKSLSARPPRKSPRTKQ